MKRPFAHLSLAVAGATLIGGARAQESAALFDAAQVAFDDRTSIRFLADVDGDGTKDAVGWWFNDQAQSTVWVSAYRREAWGTWSQMWRITTPNLSFNTSANPGIDVGDLDADGTTDFVIGLSDTVMVYRSLRTGPPVLWSTWKEPAQVLHVVVADFTGDGRPDIATLSNRIRIWRNDGAGFSLAGELGIPIGSSSVLAFQRTDANGDNAADLLLADGWALLLYTVTNGVPALTQTFWHGTNHPMPATGDIDGDGAEDIVVFGMDPAQYRVLRRTGPSTFAEEALAAGGPATDLADVDGDGDLDGVCCGGGGSGTGPNKRTSQFEISINVGKGVFAPAYGITGLGAYHIAAATDLDGDGDVDLIAGRAIYYARGSLGHDPFERLPIAVTDRVIVDVDRDGDPDVSPGIAGMLGNRGDGVFATTVPVFPDAPPGTSFEGPGFLGDFDGDGDTDLVVGHFQGSTFLGMRLLRNTGGGGFVDGGAAGAPGVDFNPVPPGSPRRNQPYRGIAVDADADGDLDLIVNPDVGQPQPRSARIFWNGGAGTFVVGPIFAFHSVDQIADLDADGLPDAILVPYATTSGGILHVAKGLGGHAFATPFSLAFGARAYVDRFQVMDWDGDGDLDIVGGYDGTDYARLAIIRIGVALNQGGFSFVRALDGPAIDLTLGDLRGAWLADVNGDGLKDFLLHPAPVTCSGTTAGTSIRLGLPGGSYGPAFVQILKPNALVDADGDGDLDVFDGSLVRRNESFAGSSAVVGARVQYGVGSQGSGGMVPTLGVSGPLRPGYAPEKRMTGAVGGSLAILVLGATATELRDVPFPGMSLYVLPLIALPVPVAGRASDPGAGEFRIPFTVTPDLLGALFFEQAFVLDPGAPSMVAATNGLVVQLGR